MLCSVYKQHFRLQYNESESVSHSVMSDFVTPWTVARQVPLSIEFSRQEQWSGLPFPSPGDLPDPGLNLSLLHCRQILYCLSHQESPQYNMQLLNFKVKKTLYLVSIGHLPIGSKNEGATFKGIKTKIEEK